MNLYLLDRKGNIGYDEFDAIVVVAESAAKARKIHPRANSQFPIHDRYRVEAWDGNDDDGTWVNAGSHRLEVKYLGKAAKGMKPGVVIASFNAG